MTCKSWKGDWEWLKIYRLELVHAIEVVLQDLIGEIMSIVI